MDRVLIAGALDRDPTIITDDAECRDYGDATVR